MNCMYCSIELGPRNKSWAHVFPDGLGGRLRGEDICCDECNNSFTNIESRCIESLAPVAAMMDARRGNGTPIATTVEHDGRRFRASQGGLYEKAPPPVDKGRVWAFPAGEADQVQVVASMLQQRGVSPEAIVDGRFQIVDAPAGSDPPSLTDPNAGIPTNMEWGYPEAKRLQFKIACELLAHSHPELARESSLESARAFARYGLSDFHVAFDASTEATGIEEIAAPFRHSIEVWTRGSCMHSRLGLFTEFRFVGTLTTSWTGSAFRLSYSFDCRNPTELVHKWCDGDGGSVVRKSARVARTELLEGAARLSETMKAVTPNARAFRAEALSADELYRRIKVKFDQKPWPLRKQ